MKSLWNDSEAKKCKNDPLKLRVYTSRLLGQNPSLVLHGGGNTSVKAQTKNIFQETEDVLFVKGSGWDLATIEAEGFAPVKMDALLKMAKLKTMRDSDMVNAQRAAMTNPGAPNPSVEAILHAIIPFKYVDHTHADAVVAISNTKNGEQKIRQIYGERMLVVPYVMPGFILAKTVYDMTKNIDWQMLDGIVLSNHGIFTFHDDAKKSYEQMIRLVSKAENYLAKSKAVISPKKQNVKEDLQTLAKVRQVVSKVRGRAVLAKHLTSPEYVQYSNLKNISAVATQGPLTPDHVIRTKRIPAILNGDHVNDIERFVSDYKKYFQRHATNGLTRMDCAPRWALWPKHGAMAFGSDLKEMKIICDITKHTVSAIMSAEKLGGWKALSEKDIFEVEYWELEQAKLKMGASCLPAFQGKVALVTGAASGIGKACVDELTQQGAVVAALDINPAVKNLFKDTNVLSIVCDLTNVQQIKKAVDETIRQFGGLDILISNAGIFPLSESIAQTNPGTWNQSLSVNLSSHQSLLQACIPYLSLGIDPAVVIIASKNVPAPGKGASAYSVAKAGLTQLARVAALELSSDGIRVNVLHPNQVFDTAIWTKEVLQKRAKSYNMSVDEYKKSNLLQVTITSKDVARLACAMAGVVFSKTTGAQVTIDGGNDRVI